MNETSKIWVGEQITMEYYDYEKKKIKYILKYNGEYLVFGIGFDIEGRFRYLKEGKCNYSGGNFEDYTNEYDFGSCRITEIE